MSLSELYKEIIIEHSKNPSNFGKIDHPHMKGFYDNPSCGDEIELQVIVNEGKIEDIKFQGRGCAISQASASMMTEAIMDKDLSEVKDVMESFESLMTGVGEIKVDLEDLETLEGVKKFPVRIKCATLAWTALKNILTEV